MARSFRCRRSQASSSDQADAPAERRQAAVGVVVPQQQAILGPAGEHAVRLVDALGHQVVDQDADVGLAAVEDERRLLLDLQRGVDAGHQPLGGGLLVAGGAVDLAGEVEAFDRLRFQRRVQLRRRGVVVFDGVAPAQHLGVLQAGDEAEHPLLHVLGQAGGDAVAVIFERVAAFRLQENLVAVLVGEADDLVLDGRAVARPAALRSGRSTSAPGGGWRGSGREPPHWCR